MLGPDQYHLTKIAEEAAEVSQRALKAMQFGFGETQPGEAEDNLQRLVGEYQDLVITFENMASYFEGLDITISDAQREKRLAKMQKFLELSQRLGQVDDGVAV